MTPAQKRGALLFFGRANCVACHAVAGPSNEMFSDFQPHRIGGPQLAPIFGIGTGNTIFDGPGENEDFGFEQTEGDPTFRYTFRTAPLRNLKVAPAFFHNGAFGTWRRPSRIISTCEASLRRYDPRANRVPADLNPGPFEGILAAGIDPLLQAGIALSAQEFQRPRRVRAGWPLRPASPPVLRAPSRGRCRVACRCNGSRGVRV